MKRDYRIGDIIRNTRDGMGITMQELCSGICDVSTLSRFESNVRIPSKPIADALLERMGMNTSDCVAFANSTEYAIHNLKNQIVNHCQLGGDMATLKKMLEELDRLENGQIPLVHQFYLRHYCMAYEDTLSLEERKKRIVEAISITIPSMGLSKITSRLLSTEEIICFVELAKIQYEEGDWETAVEQLNHLLPLVERMPMESENHTKMTILVLFYLAKFVMEKQSLEEGMALAEKGMDICIYTGKTNYLGELMAIKADALCRMGRKEEGRSLYRKSLCVLEVMGHPHVAREVKEYAESTFGMELDYEISMDLVPLLDQEEPQTEEPETEEQTVSI